MVVKGGFHSAKSRWGLIAPLTNRQTALSTPMDVFWRCEPPFTTMLLKALSTPTLVEISPLRGLSVAYDSAVFVFFSRAPRIHGECNNANRRQPQQRR